MLRQFEPDLLIVSAGFDAHERDPLGGMRLTAGAFGAYMFGIGATEMLGVLVTGEIWLKVHDTIRIEWNGRFAGGVCAIPGLVTASTAAAAIIVQRIRFDRRSLIVKV